MIARSGAELLEICRENNFSLAEYAIQYEMESKNCTREDVIKGMEKVLQVMKEANLMKGKKRSLFCKWINWRRCL